MALGLSSGGSGGEIRPLKYDAKAGRMFRIDRVQDSSGQYSTEQHEITNIAQFVADLANIRVGWINYTAQGPVRELVVLVKEPIPARPDDKNSEGKLAFKQGFELDIVLNKDSGGAPSRILGSAAGCVIDAMDELHDAYSASQEAKSGKLPVVKIASVSPVKSGQSTNYKPVFSIVSWVDRPAALQEQAETMQKGATPPATGSTPVSAPASVPRTTANSIGALCRGAGAGLTLALNVLVLLIATGAATRSGTRSTRTSSSSPAGSSSASSGPAFSRGRRPAPPPLRFRTLPRAPQDLRISR